MTLCPLTTNPVITSRTSGLIALALSSPLRISPSSSSSNPTSIARLKLSDRLRLLIGPLGLEEVRGGRNALAGIWCSFRAWIFFALSLGLASRAPTTPPPSPLRTRILWLGLRLRLTVRATPISPPTATGIAFTLASEFKMLGRSIPMRCKWFVAVALAGSFLAPFLSDSSEALRTSLESLDEVYALFICSVVSGSVFERADLPWYMMRGDACRPDFCATSAAVPLTAKRERGRTNFESFTGTAGGTSATRFSWEAGRSVVRTAA